MPNPYLWRSAITDPADFYGREEEIEVIYERIKSKDPQSVAVVGERKIGRSSLLYYIFHEKDEYLDDPQQYIFIFIDVQGESINSRDEFFKVLLKRLYENVKLRDSIVVANEDNHENIKKTLSKLNADGYKLILFLDEFELLVQRESISQELYENLRALACRYAIAYITATVKNPTELTKEYGSPFFNIFIPVTIGAFSKEEAMELIENPSAREGVPLKKEAEFVFDIAGLYPYFIQIACSILYRYKTRKEHLRRSDYDEIREKILDESMFQFKHIWGHLSKNEREVLLKLAKLKSVGEREKYILEGLKRKGYIIKKGKGYEIFSSVFNDFVAERNGKSEDKNGDTTPGYRLITAIKAIICLIIAGLVVSIIVLVKKMPGIIPELVAQIVVTGMVLSFGFVIYLIYRDIEIKYTEIIKTIYVKYRENPRKLFEGLNKLKSELEEELNKPGIFGLLKRCTSEKSYERVKKKIDDYRLDVFLGMIGERFAGLPTDLYAQIEKMLADKKVTKTEYDMFMDALSKFDMKEEDKKELENMIAGWKEKE